MKYTSLVLVAINVAIFVVQSAYTGFTESFMLKSGDVLARPWILLTSAFLHGSTTHLLGNMLALAIFGLVLENIIGGRKFLAIYFSSAIITAVASSFFYSSELGASGAIFGVIGTLTILRPRMMVWTYGVPMPMFIAAGFWLLLDVFGVFYPTNVADIAHISGLIFGVAVGITMRKRYSTAGKTRKEKTISDEEFNRWEEGWM